MNHYAMHQNAFAACEEMRGSSFVVADRKNPVFCPKPRRVGPLAGPEPVRPIRWFASFQADLCDSKAGNDFLDIFLSKGGEIATSPPFFAGSPPTRSANPVVHDARFGEDKPIIAPFSPVQSGSPISPRKPCARVKYGFKPAQVRVEGFDCLDRDRRRTHSITAMA